MSATEPLMAVAGRHPGGMALFSPLLACGHRGPPVPAHAPLLMVPGQATCCPVCMTERQLHLDLQVTMKPV